VNILKFDLEKPQKTFLTLKMTSDVVENDNI